MIVDWRVLSKVDYGDTYDEYNVSEAPFLTYGCRIRSGKMVLKMHVPNIKLSLADIDTSLVGRAGNLSMDSVTKNPTLSLTDEFIRIFEKDISKETKKLKIKKIKGN
jgi:hypothetical protein